MAFEETFGIEIPDDDAGPMQRVSDAITYIEAQVASAYTTPAGGPGDGPIDGKRTFVSAPGDHHEDAGRSLQRVT